MSTHRDRTKPWLPFVVQISDVKSADLLGKRLRLQGIDNPDFTVDKAALPPVRLFAFM